MVSGETAEDWFSYGSESFKLGKGWLAKTELGLREGPFPLRAGVNVDLLWDQPNADPRDPEQEVILREL